MVAQRLVWKSGVSRCFREMRDHSIWRQGASLKLAEFLGKVFEVLRNDALQAVMELSDDELRGEDAIDVLVERFAN